MAEHPIETARRALREAAEIDDPVWAPLYEEVAASLPCRYGQEVGMTRQQAQEEWCAVSHIERAHRILNILPDEGMTGSELNLALFREATGVDDARHGIGNVGRDLELMLISGEITRKDEPRTPGSVVARRWRYFRCKPDPGEIAKFESMIEGGR